MQEVELDSKIKLLDSPGVVFSQAKSDNTLPSVLKNAQRLTDIKDPYTAAKAVLQRASKSYFCKLYSITEFDEPEEFFAKFSQRMGKFRKGGVPDMLYSARTILNDWNTGKIKYCTHPPDESSDKTIHLSAEIVTHESRDFDINNFEEMETEVLNKFGMNSDDVIQIQSSGPVAAKVADNDEAMLLQLIGSRESRVKIIEEDESMDHVSVFKKPKMGKRKEDPAMQLEGVQRNF